MVQPVTINIENGIGFLTLNRPRKLNSLSMELVESFTQELKNMDNNDEVKVIIVSGEGTAFCAGGDLETMKKLSHPSELAHYMEMASNLTRVILNLDKYVISAVHGFAAGAGFSLALASDFIVADSTAKFGLNFVNLGVVPDLGLMKLLSERVPTPVAKEWILSGKVLSAEEAKKWGIVNQISEGNVIEDAADFSRFISQGPSLSNKYVKQMLNHTVKSDWESVLEQENLIQTFLLQTEDHQEGIKAFFDKRSPKFSGV